MTRWRVLTHPGIAAKIIEAHEFKAEPDGSVRFLTGTGETVALVAPGWKYVELVKDER